MAILNSAFGVRIRGRTTRKHGGHIGAESKPGAGEVFTLYFPTANIVDIPPEQEPPTLSAGSGRVLIMDDEPAITRIMKRMLERPGYQVESVEP